MNYLAVCDLIDRIHGGDEVVRIGAENPEEGMQAVYDTDLKTLLTKVCPQTEKLYKDAKSRIYWMSDAHAIVARCRYGMLNDSASHWQHSLNTIRSLTAVG